MQNNGSYRIRTNIGENTEHYITVKLEQDYDVLEVLSLKIDQKGNYPINNSDYGILVGRVLANGGIGVPNAHLSLFIEKDDTTDIIENILYPYSSTKSKDNEGRRYNLLFDKQTNDCHQVIGSFPNKRLMLDDTSVLEVFDKYYKYTTRTNDSGDYMFVGVPVGTYMLHMDLDISDCGKLSQRPRDFVNKGYTIEQFENPNQFKIDTDIDKLSQVFSSEISVQVKPFWGEFKSGVKEVGISRQDFSIPYKFEATCVFMGSIVFDRPDTGITKKCVPSKKMGEMNSLITGPGTIEMIRKKSDGKTVESFTIKGNQLINGNGVWCYQIPMNLDYVVTDEYGQLVPTDKTDDNGNPIGIPTRCDVRFRLSVDNPNPDTVSYNKSQILIPHNPKSKSDGYDYVFGTDTKEDSFKTLMWNNVYSVKSYIPRFQRTKYSLFSRFTGIKMVNVTQNNPMPYNNIRIQLPFMFVLMCALIKILIWLIGQFNWLKKTIMSLLGDWFDIIMPYSYISSGDLCPDLESWYFAPNMKTPPSSGPNRMCRQWENQSVCETYKDIANTADSNPNGSGISPMQYYSLNYDYFVTVLSDNTSILKDCDGTKRIVISYYDNEGTDNEPNLVLTTQELAETIDENDLATLSGITQYDVINGNTIEDDYITGAIVNKMKVEVYCGQNIVLSGYTNISISWDKAYISGATNDKLSVGDTQSTDGKNALSNGELKIHLTSNVDYLQQCIEVKLADEYNVIKFDFYNDWINGCIYIPGWSRTVKLTKKRRHGETIIETKEKGCFNNGGFTGYRKYYQQCTVQYDKDFKAKEYCGTRCHRDEGRSYINIFGDKSGLVYKHKNIRDEFVYYMKPCEFVGNTRVILFATDIIMLGSLFDCNEYGLPSTFGSLRPTTYQMPPQLASTNLDDDSDGYGGSQTGATPSNIRRWRCNSKCNKGGIKTRNFLENGVEKKMLSLNEMNDLMNNIGALEATTGGDGVLDYEDVFPVTEISGVDWGYEGAHTNLRGKNLNVGGHFLGLGCFFSETTVKSCINLQRACEIGTTFSERLEIPAGYEEKDSINGNTFENVNYLFVAPNGLIAKDQINDVTFRSAFATMNQNSLKTKDNGNGYKIYDFEYLLPDSFDGALSDAISGYTQIIQQDAAKEQYWAGLEDTLNTIYSGSSFETQIKIEQGNTIIRDSEIASKDYITFRMGKTPKMLMSNALPVYENSFYFYFGLINGSTALDEFKKQFYAKCSADVIIEQVGDLVISIDNKTITKNLTFDVNIEVGGLEPDYTYTLTRLVYDDFKIFKNGFYIPDVNGNITENSEAISRIERDGSSGRNIFKITGLEMGRYKIVLQDGNGHVLEKTFDVGLDIATIDYDKDSIVDYYVANTGSTVGSKIIEGIGGYINGSFILSLSDEYQLSENCKLSYFIKKTANESDNEIHDSVVFHNMKNWAKRFKNQSQRFYFWGDSEYEVWVVVKDEENKCYSAFRYDTLIVGEGDEMQLFYDDGIMEPYNYNFDTNTWWSEKLLGEDTVVGKNLYRYAVNYSKNDSFKLSVQCGTNKLISCCQGEIYNQSENIKHFTQLYKILIETRTQTDESEGYQYDTSKVALGMNEDAKMQKLDGMEDGKRGPIFFTSANDTDNAWSTYYCDVKINAKYEYAINLKYVGNKMDEKYLSIVNYIKNVDKLSSEVLTDIEKKYMKYFLIKNDENHYHMVYCSIINDYIVINECLDTDFETFKADIDGKNELTLIHLMLSPVYRKPYEVSIVSYLNYGEQYDMSKYVAQCYQNKLTVVGSFDNVNKNRMVVTFNELQSTANDNLAPKTSVTFSTNAGKFADSLNTDKTDIKSNNYFTWVGYNCVDSEEDFKNINTILNLDNYHQTSDILSRDKIIFEAIQWKRNDCKILLINKLWEPK